MSCEHNSQSITVAGGGEKHEVCFQCLHEAVLNKLDADEEAMKKSWKKEAEGYAFAWGDAEGDEFILVKGGKRAYLFARRGRYRVPITMSGTAALRKLARAILAEVGAR